MPSSNIYNIAPIIEKVCELNPASILDLGPGCGKYGALIREYHEVNRFKIKPSQWTVKLHGVEAFQDYRNPMWQMYDFVANLNFADKKNWPLFANYDLVLLIDSLEHVERPLGDMLLSHLRQHNKNVIVSVPDGEMPQGAWGGNDLETHRATWTRQDLVMLGGQVFHSGVCAIAHFS